MTDTKPRQIVESAISANALRDLLLGRAPYRYLPAGSPAPGETDLAVLLASLYDEVREVDRERLRAIYQSALESVLETEEGIGPVAYAVVFEALRKARKRAPMDLALGELAEKLRCAIDIHRDTLMRDFSGAGRGWANGWLGELGRLSVLSEELQGPSFM